MTCSCSMTRTSPYPNMASEAASSASCWMRLSCLCLARLLLGRTSLNVTLPFVQPCRVTTMESVTRIPLEPPGSVTVLQGLLDLCVRDRFALPTRVYMEEPALDKQTRMGSSASVLMEDEEPSARKPSPSINPPSPAGWLDTLPS